MTGGTLTTSNRHLQLGLGCDLYNWGAVTTPSSRALLLLQNNIVENRGNIKSGYGIQMKSGVTFTNYEYVDSYSRANITVDKNSKLINHGRIWLRDGAKGWVTSGGISNPKWFNFPDNSKVTSYKE